MPYSKSNKKIQDSAFKLRSGNTTPFKQMGSSPVKWNPFFIKSAKTEKYDVEGGGEGVKKTYKNIFTGRTKTKETQKTDDAKRKETIVYNKDGSIKSKTRKRTNK
jgi:hypothetical protein